MYYVEFNKKKGKGDEASEKYIIKKRQKFPSNFFLSNKYAKDILYFYAHWWISNNVFIFVTFKKSDIIILYGSEAASLKYDKIKYEAFSGACFFDTICL